MATHLFYTQTSCGAASYISAHTAGLIPSKVVPNETDIRSHIVLKGPNAQADYYKINPKGNVPGLVLADGTLLNENSASLQYIADLNSTSNLAPANGTSARYLLQSKLNWLSSELHTSIGAHFNPTLTAEQKAFFTAAANRRLTYLNDVELSGGKKYLVGDHFTVADAYCGTILGWTGYVGVDISAYKNVVAYLDNFNNLENVKAARAAMAAEK
ncbi:putative glutathione S-transferase [Cladochytrium replicatum]|nr:putative glutathione S-transferase [Cladochytrium replicatum]